MAQFFQSAAAPALACALESAACKLSENFASPQRRAFSRANLLEQED